LKSFLKRALGGKFVKKRNNFAGLEKE
jgi:hypothetical protein